MGEEITISSDLRCHGRRKRRLLKGVVLKVDSFGNLITNFRGEDLPDGAIQKGEINLQVGSYAISKAGADICAWAAGENDCVCGI